MPAFRCQGWCGLFWISTSRLSKQGNQEPVAPSTTHSVVCWKSCEFCTSSYASGAVVSFREALWRRQQVNVSHGRIQVSTRRLNPPCTLGVQPNTFGRLCEKSQVRYLDRHLVPHHKEQLHILGVSPRIHSTNASMCFFSSDFSLLVEILWLAIFKISLS